VEHQDTPQATTPRRRPEAPNPPRSHESHPTTDPDEGVIVVLSLAPTLAIGIAVASLIAIAVIVVAPWPEVRAEPPLDETVESRLLLGEDPAQVAADSPGSEARTDVGAFPPDADWEPSSVNTAQLRAIPPPLPSPTNALILGVLSFLIVPIGSLVLPIGVVAAVIASRVLSAARLQFATLEVELTGAFRTAAALAIVGAATAVVLSLVLSLT